ncbi:hypothetical protein PENSPDRAFT_687528 [Peniophora sp. CONT]|nr:hypothetical protein PENSPDRAFT_687528 [Peniophora sp. CONT]
MRLRNIFRKRHDDKSASIVYRVPEDSIEHPTLTTHSPKLPDDIIYELFEAAALVYPPRALVMMPASAQALAHTHTLLGWIILTHICRRWRAIGFSATLAHIWARVVCLSWKPSVAMELSQRARGYPVTIDLTRFNGIIRPGSYELLPLEDWAFRNISNVDVLIAPGTIFLNHLNRHKAILPALREIQFGRTLSGLPVPIEWEAPGLRSARLNMAFLPNHMAQGLRELHLRVHADRMRLTALRDYLRLCSLLEVLDVNVTGEWSRHEGRPDDWLPLDYLNQAKIVVNADQAAVDVWKPVIGPAHLTFSLVFASDKSVLPCSRILLDACAREMDSQHYDTMEVCMLGNCTGRSDLRLRLSSSSSPSPTSCELLFPTDEIMRATVLSLLPPFIPTAFSHIRNLTLDALLRDMVHAAQESFCALGRALTGVENLELRGMDYRSAATHVHTLRQTRHAPVLPALQTIRISDVHLPEMRDGSELEMMETREWWDMITIALTTRKESELGALGRLVLSGTWAGKDGWSGREDSEGREEIKANALASELVDGRVWIE